MICFFYYIKAVNNNRFVGQSNLQKMQIAFFIKFAFLENI